MPFSSTVPKSKIYVPLSDLIYYRSVFIAPSSNGTISSTNIRLKQELQTLVSTSKKRPATDDSDDDVTPLDLPSSSVVRPPVKKLPNSKPDFDSFAPKDRKF